MVLLGIGTWYDPKKQLATVLVEPKRSILGVTSPFFPGIFLSRKPPNTLGKWLVIEKNDG